MVSADEQVPFSTSWPALTGVFIDMIGTPNEEEHRSCVLRYGMRYWHIWHL